MIKWIPLVPIGMQLRLSGGWGVSQITREKCCVPNRAFLRKLGR